MREYKPRQRRLKWREFHFTSCDEQLDMDSLMRGGAFSNEVKWRWDAGGTVLITNAPLTDLRLYARRYFGIELPDYVTAEGQF